MRSYAATDREVLRKVRIPNMLPFFFTALKVSTTLAFIGAIVGEYFGGASKVLGTVVITSMCYGSFALAWARHPGRCGLRRIIAYLLVALVERLAIPWYDRAASERALTVGSAPIPTPCRGPGVRYRAALGRGVRRPARRGRRARRPRGGSGPCPERGGCWSRCSR